MTWDELRAEAFGEIGLNPEEFYNMDRDDYWLLHKGFFNKRLYERRIMRKYVVDIISLFIKVPISQFSYEPLEGDEELRQLINEYQKHRNAHVSEESLKILRAFKEKEANQNPKGN